MFPGRNAIRSFPYSIYPIETGEELRSQLSKNPNFVLQGFLGMQPRIQQAVNDLGLHLEDYGRKGSGHRGSKGKGKGKRSDYPPKKWELQQDDDEEEENKDLRSISKWKGCHMGQR